MVRVLSAGSRPHDGALSNAVRRCMVVHTDSLYAYSALPVCMHWCMVVRTNISVCVETQRASDREETPGHKGCAPHWVLGCA
eukprot:620630-Pelagomonas_calceolata.AAC.1